MKAGLHLLAVALVVGGCGCQQRPQPIRVTDSLLLKPPLILVAFAALGVYSQIDTLQFIDEMNIDFLDAGEARFNALRFATVGIVSFILFLWNAVDWVRGRNEAQTI